MVSAKASTRYSEAGIHLLVEKPRRQKRHSIKNNPITTKIVYSVAIVQRLGHTVAQVKFSEQDQNTSSTYRELAAIVCMLQSFKNLLINESIQWNSNNQNVERILQVGSIKPDLHSLALQIYYMCIQNNNRIHSVWIPREENTLADHYSRPNDTDDFGIDFKHSTSFNES